MIPYLNPENKCYMARNDRINLPQLPATRMLSYQKNGALYILHSTELYGNTPALDVSINSHFNSLSLSNRQCTFILANKSLKNEKPRHFINILYPNYLIVTIRLLTKLTSSPIEFIHNVFCFPIWVLFQHICLGVCFITRK